MIISACSIDQESLVELSKFTYKLRLSSYFKSLGGRRIEPRREPLVLRQAFVFHAKRSAREYT